MLFYTIIFILLGLDQITKGIIQRALVLHQSITIIPGVLSLTRVNNPGAAFGILPHKTIFLIVMPLLLFFLVFLFRRVIAQYPFAFRIGLAFCLSGAAGNLVDRLWNGGQVIDFIDLEFWPLANFPLFNLADVAIFVGALLVLYSLRRLEN